MSIEHCQNFGRAFTSREHREVSFCRVVGTDLNCGGYSDHCPTKMRKHFKPDRDVPRESITFVLEPLVEYELIPNENEPPANII